MTMRITITVDKNEEDSALVVEVAREKIPGCDNPGVPSVVRPGVSQDFYVHPGQYLVISEEE